MIFRSASLEAVTAGHVLVAFVHSVDVLPEMRCTPVAFVAQIAGEKAMGHAAVIAQLLKAVEPEIVAYITTQIERQWFDWLG